MYIHKRKKKRYLPLEWEGKFTPVAGAPVQLVDGIGIRGGGGGSRDALGVGGRDPLPFSIKGTKPGGPRDGRRRRGWQGGGGGGGIAPASDATRSLSYMIAGK